MREKVGKSRSTVFFQWFVAPEGRKVGSLKRRVRSQLARWEMKSCTPLWREAHLEVNMLKTPGVRTTFGSCDAEKVHAVVARSTFPSQNVQSTTCSRHFWRFGCRKSARRCGAKHISKAHHSRTAFGSSDVEKVHAVLARSTFPSQNVQNTPFSDRFWKFGCRKSARRCGVKHISKSKCTKHHMFEPLLEVRMSKKCTPLWREGHFEVNMFKTLGVRTTFGGSGVASLQYTTLQDITLQYTPLHYITQHYNYNYTTTLHYAPLHSTTLNYTTLHYITRHSTTLHYITLHYTTLPSSTLHYITLHYTPLHYNYNYNYTTTLHYNTLRYTTLNYTTLHYTTLHSTTLHYITLHYTTLRYTSLHYTTLHSTTNITTTTQLHSTTLHYIPLHYITLHYATFHYTPLHHTPLHYTTLHWMTLHHR